MKLFDFLRTLNGPTVADPDTPDIDLDAEREQLLAELGIILDILDGGPADGDTAATAPAVTPVTAQPLNLDTIFDDGLTSCDGHAEPLPPAAWTDGERRQCIGDLLTHLLPRLEQALAARLTQLDDATLRAWRDALAS